MASLAQLYSLRDRTNPALERAKITASSMNAIPQDKYGYSSIAKIPLMYMYGQQSGEAANIDVAQNEQINKAIAIEQELMQAEEVRKAAEEKRKETEFGWKGTEQEYKATEEARKVAGEGRDITKSQADIQKTGIDTRAKIIETAQSIKDDNARKAYLNQNADALGMDTSTWTISYSKQEGKRTITTFFNKKDSSTMDMLMDEQSGIYKAMGNQWVLMNPDETDAFLSVFSKTAPPKSDVLSDKALAQREKIAKAGRSITEADILKQSLGQYKNQIDLAMKDPDEINRLPQIKAINNQFAGRIPDYYLYKPVETEPQSENSGGFLNWMKNLFGRSSPAPQSSVAPTPAEVYSKPPASKTPPTPMGGKPLASQNKGRVIRDTVTGKRERSDGINWIEIK